MLVIHLGLILLVLFGITASIGETNFKTSKAYTRPIIKLKEGFGLVEGQYETTGRNITYASFYGIPFANPPIGVLRFKDPLPPIPTNETLRASTQRDVCIQLGENGNVIGNEDCLYLNIFSPLITQNKLPVIVYIHGGAFVSGSPVINGHVLLENDVVVVSITYRVGIIGFLNLDTEEVPGNAGLKDQVLALKWIKENIGLFGGDEDNITLLGLSAGGTSVNNHQLSPMSKHLFHKVIAMSGTILTPWGIQREPQNMVTSLIKILDIDTNQKSLLENLQNIKVNDLVIASRAVQSDPGGFTEEPSFGPVVEKHFENVPAFFDKDPMDYVKSAAFFDVPVIFGHVSKEYLLFTTKDLVATIINNNVNIVPKRWRVKYSKVTTDILAQIIKEFYFGQKGHIDVNDSKNFDRAIDVLSDVTFIMSTIDAVRLQAEYSKSNIYHYKFTYRGRLNNPKVEEYDLNGATHGDDLKYLFILDNPRVEEESPDGIIRASLANMFVNFAKKGNPNDDLGNSLGINWSPVTNGQNNYLEINNELIPRIDPDEDRRLFWKNLEENLENGNILI